MNLESRIAALELLAAKEPSKVIPTKTPLSFVEFQNRMKEILNREMPDRTQEEVIADFKAGIVRMRANWAVRHEQS